MKVVVGAALFRWLWTLLFGRRRRPKVLSRDDLTLSSSTLGLVGQPDRLVQTPAGDIIVYEKKSHADRVFPNIRRQLGAYFLLVEAHYGRRPSHGFAVLAGDRHVRVTNTEALRRDVLRTAGQIRQQRRRLSTPARTTATANQCRHCSFRDACTEKRG